MYTYYVIRGTRAGKPVELDGEIDEAHFPGVELDEGPAILNYLVQQVNAQAETAGEWNEAELTDSFFNLDDTYIYFNGRWMRRSNAPWRKDRNN